MCTSRLGLACSVVHLVKEPVTLFNNLCSYSTCNPSQLALNLVLIYSILAAYMLPSLLQRGALVCVYTYASLVWRTSASAELTNVTVSMAHDTRGVLNWQVPEFKQYVQEKCASCKISDNLGNHGDVVVYSCIGFGRAWTAGKHLKTKSESMVWMFTMCAHVFVGCIQCERVSCAMYGDSQCLSVWSNPSTPLSLSHPV
jgi:hypothetical protein